MRRVADGRRSSGELNATLTARSPAGARISARWWRVILFCGRTEQFGEDRLQCIRPHLIALGRWMKFIIRIHHAIEELAVSVCQLVIDIQIADSFAIGELG